MTIEKYDETIDTCTLYISNVRYYDKINRCLDIIKLFGNEKYYFSIYRIDRVNLSKKDFCEYGEIISKYLQQIHNFEIIKSCKKGEKLADQILNAVGKLKAEELTEILPKIFDYYLETIVYVPKIPFPEFKKIFEDSPMQGLHYYIRKKIADISFAHIDSGDFMICFNTQKYTESYVRNKLEILFK